MLSSRRTHSFFDSPSRVVAGALFILAAALLILRLTAPSALYALARPLWNIGVSFTAATSGQFESRAALVQDRDQLQAQNAALTAQNAALTAEAHDLQALLGSRQAPPKELVAGVLAGPPVAPYDVLIVDQGAADGVKEGAPAYGPGGTPIGRVTLTEPHTARISLFSAPGTGIDAWLGDTRVPVALKGVGAGAFQATISKDAGATAGESVYVAGPGSLPIGTIAKVDSDPSSPMVVLHVRPYVNPFSITWVTIQPAYGS